MDLSFKLRRGRNRDQAVNPIVIRDPQAHESLDDEPTAPMICNQAWPP
jgi:hypothetical protein